MNPLKLATRLVLASIASLPACGPCKNSQERIRDSAGWVEFGAPISGAAMGISLDLLIASPANFDGGTFLVRDATIESVSKQDGRWFMVSDGGAPVRVTFKNPLHAVPVDCEGRSAVLHGEFRVMTVAEAVAKRTLEDAGHHDAAVKLAGDQTELTFFASGVRLSR